MLQFLNEYWQIVWSVLVNYYWIYSTLCFLIIINYGMGEITESKEVFYKFWDEFFGNFIPSIVLVVTCYFASAGVLIILIFNGDIKKHSFIKDKHLKTFLLFSPVLCLLLLWLME